MSDRSYCQLIIKDCPEEQRAAAIAAIEEEYFSWEPDTDDATQPIGRYNMDESPLDESETIAAELIEVAPGASFVTWTDPKYEYPGIITMYTPELGRFDATCDSEGRPYWTAEEIAALPDDPSARRLALGIPWQEALWPKAEQQPA